MGFPLSIAGSLVVPAMDPAAYDAAVRAHLRGHKAVSVDGPPGDIVFRGGFGRLRQRSNPLAAMSIGHISTRRTAQSTGGLEVQFDVSIAGVTVLMIVISLGVGTVIGWASQTVEVGLLVGSIYWVLLFGLNFLVIKRRFRRMLADAATIPAP